MKKLVFIACLGMTASVQAQELEEVVVKAHPLSDKGLSQAVTVLAGDELAEQVQSSLGETVSASPGIRSASFGGAVGRPVIHGLGGARIKTTEDRIDSLDVSVTSSDHAVTVEPFIANQITILKGASTLLYGAGAIGGVVDTETGRIPTELTDSSFSGRGQLSASDNADGTVATIRLDGKASEQIAWHFDAFSKEADDYEIAGELESAALREFEGEEHEEEGEDVGVLEGSRYDVSGGALGLSWVGETGFIGASISKVDAVYGLIGAHSHGDEDHDEHEDEHDEEGHDEHDEEHEEGVGIIELEQTRYDLEAQLNDPFSGVEKINFRLGINDYQHSEIEGSGEVGTVFDNDAWEARLELTHQPIAGFAGAFGIQSSGREFSALGEEAFVEPVDTDTLGVFWVSERDFDDFSVEVGARLEQVEHSPVFNIERDFSSSSASLGLVYPLNKQLTWSVLLDYTERAPSIEELYSNGAHLATQTFEIGDENLSEESGLSFTLTLNYQSDMFDLNASFYRTNFNDFIYQSFTGELDDELPVLVHQQNDAEFTGVDLEMGVHLSEIAGGDLDLLATFDTVNAELVQGLNEYLPRIPSNRFGVGLAWHNDLWRAKIDYRHTSEQNDLAPLELASEAFNDLSVKLSRRIELEGLELQFFVQGRNLSDEEQRQHVSFLKDLAPAPGRRIEAGVRFKF